MKFLNELVLFESARAAEAEVKHAVTIINKIYKEWHKTKRRINAVDLVTTSVNKIATIHPDTVGQLNPEIKLKLVTLIMRSLDTPAWKPADAKKSIYKKLYPLLDKLQLSDPNTGSGGNLREVILTRLSATLAYKEKGAFVAYEPVVSASYLRYLFGEDAPEKVFKMQAMRLPDDFPTLIATLQTNHDKAVAKLSNVKPQ